LQEQDMTRYDAVNYISHGIAKRPSLNEPRVARGVEQDQQNEGEQGDGKKKSDADALDAYCINLNRKAESGRIDPLIGRTAEVQTVIGAGATSGGAMDASNLLKPALAGGSLRCIGSTTYKEYRQHFEKDRALVRRFQKIDINEPSIDDAVKILKGLKPYFEDFHKVHYTDEAIEQAVQLSARYMSDRKLPDKAIDVIDET